jgi:hypothetical protein
MSTQLMIITRWPSTFPTHLDQQDHEVEL